MLSLLQSSQPARWCRAAGAVLLALVWGPAWAQTAPHPPAVRMGSWPPIPTPLYFVDAQRVDSAGFSSLSPNDIANIQVVKGAAARALDASATGRGLIAITTKQNEQNAKVLAFSQQVERVIKEYKPHSEAVIQAENAIEPADLRYYLNNSASTILELNSLDAHTVTGVRTLHGQRAANYAHDASVTEVILVTTRP